MQQSSHNMNRPTERCSLVTDLCSAEPKPCGTLHLLVLLCLPLLPLISLDSHLFFPFYLFPNFSSRIQPPAQINHHQSLHSQAAYGMSRYDSHPETLSWVTVAEPGVLAVKQFLFCARKETPVIRSEISHLHNSACQWPEKKSLHIFFYILYIFFLFVAVLLSCSFFYLIFNSHVGWILVLC